MKQHLGDEDAFVRGILELPYSRVFLLNDGGVFTGLVLEFPGCISQGTGIYQALCNLNEAMESWALAARAQGQTIPEPLGDPVKAIRDARRMGIQDAIDAVLQLSSGGPSTDAAIGEDIGYAKTAVALNKLLKRGP